jgi:orotate phosphoribosyltransferase
MKLQESEVLMRQGHFDSGNGFHGRVYLNPHQLFRYPSTIWQLAQDLLDILPGHLLDRTEVVAGPATGGALLAHTLAGLLDGRRALTHPPCSFAPFTISGDGFVLRDFYAREMAGRRVLLADDVRNTGKIRRRRTIRSRTARCAWRASRLRPSEQEAVRGASRGGDGCNGTSFNT